VADSIFRIFFAGYWNVFRFSTIISVIVTVVTAITLAPVFYAFDLRGQLREMEAHNQVRLLSSDQKVRMRPLLHLEPDETYSVQVNSAPNCDECEQYAESIREFLLSVPGWKAGGSAIIFAEPFRRRRGIALYTRDDEKNSKSVEKISSAFAAAGILLAHEIENYPPGLIIIVVYRASP
jgi:hypothetical protein